MRSVEEQIKPEQAAVRTAASFFGLGLSLGPVYRCALQTPSGDLFMQCQSALLDGIVGHELVRLVSVQFDLAANMIVEVQKTFVVQINYRHKRFSDTQILSFEFCRSRPTGHSAGPPPPLVETRRRPLIASVRMAGGVASTNPARPRLTIEFWTRSATHPALNLTDQGYHARSGLAFEYRSNEITFAPDQSATARRPKAVERDVEFGG
jgi:hypothetical protein